MIYIFGNGDGVDNDDADDDGGCGSDRYGATAIVSSREREVDDIMCYVYCSHSGSSAQKLLSGWEKVW